jgi:hypothetical protein
MTEHDEKWNMQFEQLVKFDRTNGGPCCMAPRHHEQDKLPGQWVQHAADISWQKNKIRLDQKRVLDDIKFAWKDDSTHTIDQKDKLWHQQHEKLVEFEQKSGHCVVPLEHEQDASLLAGQWVVHQRTFHDNNELRQDQKRALEDLRFA